MRKGFVLDDDRLKNLGGGGYFKELLERIRDIRDIRASEKVFYRQILESYATSIDYDPKAEISIVFFQNVVAKNYGAICLISMPNIIKHCTLIKSIKSPETYHVPYTEVVSCKFQNDAKFGWALQCFLTYAG